MTDQQNPDLPPAVPQPWAQPQPPVASAVQQNVPPPPPPPAMQPAGASLAPPPVENAVPPVPAAPTPPVAPVAPPVAEPVLADDEVVVNVPRGFTLRLDTDINHQIVVSTGVQRMKKVYAEHWYSKANGVEIFKG